MARLQTRRLVVAALIAALLSSSLGAATVSGRSAPSSYYGPAVTDDGTPLPDGTTVVAVVDGSVRDQITVSDGTYGGNDPLDDKLRVSETDATIRFYVETDDGTRIEANRTDAQPTAGTQRFPLAFPAGTGTGESNFEVTAFRPGETTVYEDQSVTVNATITNRVEAGTETVALRIDGRERATRSVTLATGESDHVTFSIDPSSLATGEQTYTVATEHDERTATLTVRSSTPDLTVGPLDPSSLTLDRATLFDVSASITNEGTEQGTQTVALTVDGFRVNATTVTLARDQQETVTFAAINSSQFNPGEHTYTIRTANDSRSGTMTVEGPAPPTFTVLDLDPDSTTVAAGERVELSALIENTGSRDGTQRLRFLIDGDRYFARSLSLTAGNRTNAVFTADTAPLAAGEHSFTFATEDNTESGTLNIEQTTPATVSPTATVTATPSPETTATDSSATDSHATDTAPTAETATDETASAAESPPTETTDGATTKTASQATGTVASTTAVTTATQSNETASNETRTTTADDGGGLFGLLQSAAVALGGLLVAVYVILKALALYLGY